MENGIQVNKNLDLIGLKDDFINYLDVSDKTILTYQKSLKRFFEYLSDNNIKSPSRENIIAFRESCKNLKPTTIQTYMNSIRQFFKWLEYKNLYPNIANNVKGVKVERFHRKSSLTIEEVMRINENLTSLRDKVLFNLLVTTGLRATEAKDALIEDIKYVNGTRVLYIMGKGRAEKEFVKLSEGVFKLLIEYIGERSKGFIFVNERKPNEGVTYKTISYVIKGILVDNGLDGEEYTCHSLRHTAINLGLESGLDLREVSSCARHKNIATTQIYMNEINRFKSMFEENISAMIGIR